MADRLCVALRGAAQNRLYRSSFIILASQGGTSIIGYVFWAVAAHHARAATIGLTGSLVSGVGAATLFSTTGITVGIIPVVARTTGGQALADEILGAAVGTVALSACGGAVLTLILPRITPSLAPAGDITVAPALFLLQLATGVGLLIDSVSLGRSRPWIMLVRALIASLVRLTVFVIPASLSVGGLIWAFALALALADVIGTALLFSRRAGRVQPRALTALLRRRTYYLGNHLTSVGGAAAVYLLPIVVLTQRGPRDAGYFYPTWLLAGMFFTVSPAVSSAYLAWSRPQGGSPLRKLYEPIVLILVLLAIPMAVAVFDPRLILRLLGPGYVRRSSGLMTLLAISAIPDAVTNVAVASLRLQSRLRAASILNGGMSIMTLALAAALLPHTGLAGAGEAWLIAQTVGACAVPLLLKREGGLGSMRRPKRQPHAGHASHDGAMPLSARPGDIVEPDRP